MSLIAAPRRATRGYPSLIAFLCLLTTLLSCRKPVAVDLSLESPKGFYLDEEGKQTLPPDDRDFTSRLSLPAHLKSEARVWLRYDLPADPAFNRLMSRHCTNILGTFQDKKPIETSDQKPFAADPVSFATIVKSEQPSSLTFKVGLSEQRRFDLSCRSLQITTQNTSIWYYIIKSSPLLISGSMMVFGGILTLVLTSSLFSWTLLHFGLMSLAIGLYVLSGLSGASAQVAWIEGQRMSWVFLIFCSYLFFFEQLVGSPRKSARLLGYCNLAIFAILQMYFLLNPDSNPHSLARAFLGLVILDLVAALALVIASIAQKKAFSKTLGLIAAALTIFLTIDMYNQMESESHDPMLLSPWIFLGLLTFTLFRVLTSRIDEQVRIEKDRTILAKKRNLELAGEVERRTVELSRRSQELEAAHGKLEERIEILTRQKQTASSVARENDALLLNITEIKNQTLPRIIRGLQKLHDFIGPNDPARILSLFAEIDRLLPQSETISSERSLIHNAFETIQLLSANKRHQRTFRSAIGGARLELKTFEDSEALINLEDQSDRSRLILIDDHFIESLPAIHESNLDAMLVVFSEKGSAAALEYQLRFPMINQVITVDLPKAILQKLLLTHLTKLISPTHDLFGIEKYLMWGSAIQEQAINIRSQANAAWEGLRIDSDSSGLVIQFGQKASMIAKLMYRMRSENILSYGSDESHKLGLLRHGHDTHLFALSIDLSGKIFARQDIIGVFSDGPKAHPVARALLEQSHALILNSNGHDRHELIVLLFEASDEIPPAYFYSFIFSDSETSR